MALGGTVTLSADSFFIHCSLVHGEEGSSILVDIISSLSEILSVQVSLTSALPFTLFLSLDPRTVAGVVEGALGWGVNSDFCSLLHVWLAVRAQGVP